MRKSSSSVSPYTGCARVHGVYRSPRRRQRRRWTVVDAFPTTASRRRWEEGRSFRCLAVNATDTYRHRRDAVSSRAQRPESTSTVVRRESGRAATVCAYTYLSYTVHHYSCLRPRVVRVSVRAMRPRSRITGGTTTTTADDEDDWPQQQHNVLLAALRHRDAGNGHGHNVRSTAQLNREQRPKSRERRVAAGTTITVTSSTTNIISTINNNNTSTTITSFSDVSVHVQCFSLHQAVDGVCHS